MQEPQTVIVQRDGGSAYWIFGILLIVAIAGGIIYYMTTQAPGTSPTTVIHNTITVPAGQPANGTTSGGSGGTTSGSGSGSGSAPANP